MDVIDHQRRWQALLARVRVREAEAWDEASLAPWRRARLALESAVAALKLAVEADRAARDAIRATAGPPKPARPVVLGLPAPGPMTRRALRSGVRGELVRLADVVARRRPREEYEAALRESRATLRALGDQVLRCVLGVALKGPLRPPADELVRTTVWFYGEQDLRACDDPLLRGLGRVVERLDELVEEITRKCG